MREAARSREAERRGRPCPRDRFALSPDRAHLAITAKPSRDADFELRITGIDGAPLVTVPTTIGTGARWVGDGRHVAFTTARSNAGRSVTETAIAVMQPDGGGLHLVTPQARFEDQAGKASAFHVTLGNGAQ